MKKIFVSDVHMGAGRSFQSGYTGYVYDWFDQKDATAFAECLAYINSSPDVEEVILLGDIMDNWVCPVDSKPPTFEEVAAAEVNKSVMSGLRTLSSNKRTIYIPGNHDMSATGDFLRANFGNITIQNEYDKDGIFASHGSEYSIFCAPDPVNDPISHLPIGYYISRVAATDQARTGSKHYLRDYIKALEDFLSEKFVLAVFDAAKDAAHLTDAADIAMLNGTISVEEVKNRFINRYKQWEESDNLIPAKAACVDEINELWSAVYELHSQKEYEIIILGHTHDASLKKYLSQVMTDDAYIYANTGAWCFGGKFTFVETEMSDDGGEHYVRLRTWDSENHRLADRYEEEYIE